MSIRVPTLRHVFLGEDDSAGIVASPTADVDIITGADTLDSRGVTVVLIAGAFAGYHATGYAEIILRHSESHGSGYVNVPTSQIESDIAPLADGRLLRQSTVIASGDHVVRTFSYTGPHRYLAVRLDLHGGISGCPWAAAVILTDPLRAGP